MLMPLELTPDVKVTRDGNGKIRQLSHPQQYRPAAVEMFARGMAPPLTPRTLAEQYLRDASSIFEFGPAETANFAAKSGPSPTTAGVELRFKEEKAVGSSVAVAYDQTVYGLPIWDAGVTVRIDGKLLGVTGAHNANHYHVEAQQPTADAPFLPNVMGNDKLTHVLGLASDSEIKINGTRALVYRYRPEERYDAQVSSHQNADAGTGLTGNQAVEFPVIKLPDIPAIIKAEQHYVVTEVLFSYRYLGWGEINWRIFVDPQTGAVLYLRALVACAHGAVFLTDPVTSTGTLYSAGSSPSVLDGIRSTLPLLGLKAPSPSGSPQELQGEYVKLVNLEVPNTAMPAEAPPYDFLYSCNTANFAACNAYHHCDGFFRLIQEMGIDVNTYFDNTDFPVKVDPHSLSGQVNAQAAGNVMGNGLGKLVFGVAQPRSNFGISADVRVVVHEFGHGILWDHVDSPNFGFAHSPGDSLGAILFDPLSKAPDRFETFPFMKESAGLSRRHDREVAQGWGWFGRNWDTQYGGEEVLSTTLFRIYRAAGGDSPDLADKQFASRYVSYLIIKAVGLLSFTTSNPDVFVAALTEADATTEVFEGHPGGSFSKVIRWSFEQQGLYQAEGSPLPVTQVGEPPEVDVYIEDGRKGSYMPYRTDYKGTAEIWNRTTEDGGTIHQEPAIGVKSFAYARIRNRGTQPATDVMVRGFQTRNAQAATWPTDWKALVPASINLPGSIVPDGESIVGPFPWIPQAPGESLLLAVSAAGDHSNLESVTAGPIANARLIQLDNNLAQRTFLKDQTALA